MGLWRKNGGPPQELPFEDALSDGSILTNLINRPENRAALGWVAEPDPPPELPDEIPMHKARKALRMRGPGGEVVDQDDPSWFEMVTAVIAGVPDKVLRGSLEDELNTAPNMVLNGENTLMLRAAIGMTQEQFEEVAWLALSLP